MKAVRWDSVLRATIRGRSSSSARSVVIGGADQPRGVPDEERHLLGRGVLGGHDQVAFVLPVLVVDDDDDPPRPMAATASSMVAVGHALVPPALGRSAAPAASSRSAYLAITSTSRLTSVAGPLWPRVVTCRGVRG